MLVMKSNKKQMLKKKCQDHKFQILLFQPKVNTIEVPQKHDF